jgi:endonuclease/exonuclease/phosphatase family metal-dependent hydrolase
MAAPPLRLATLNMLLGGGRRVDPARVLQDTRADVLLLQEAPPPERRPDIDVLWTPAPERRWGSAIVVSRGRLEPLRVNRHAGWVVAARWQLEGRAPVDLVSIHVPQGPGGFVAGVHAVLDGLHGRRAADLVIGGDFNVCVSRRHHTGGPARDPELALLARLGDEFGVFGCWDALHPRARPPQTLRWSGDRSIPYHCDGLFVPVAWRDRLQRCVVLGSERWQRRSDHLPVLATFTAG